MATIYDVARYAGVSKSTVSLVINNSPLVREATRKKVLQAIADMNYVPNRSAQGLSVKTTNCLGVVIMSEEAPVIRYDFDQHVGLCSYNIMNGIVSALTDTRYGIIMESFCSTANPGEVPNVVRNHRVDGVFIVGSPYDRRMLEKLRAMRFPFVMVGVSSYDENADSVHSDPGEGVALGMELFAQKGYREVFFLNCPKAFASAYVRLDAYISAAAQHGFRVRPEWIVNCEHNNGKGGYDQMKAAWEKGIRPRAILAANANLALGAMRYLNEQRIRVPEDVSVMAYEDSSLSGYAIPALTTVNIHKEQMGEKAAGFMLRRLADPDAPPEHYTAPCELVLRDSVISASEQRPSAAFA